MLIPLQDSYGEPGWFVSPVLVFRSAGMPAHRVLEFSGASGGDFLPLEKSTRACERIAADPWFQEAVGWQNPGMLDDWLAGYRADERRRTKPAWLRYRNMAVARYVQRYTTKNDTIGFFGPLAWARFDADSVGVVADVGSGTEVRRRAYFEPWAIDALARVWELDPDIRPHLCPRLVASARLDGIVLRQPSEQEIALTPTQALVSGLCDGTRDVYQITHALNAAGHPLRFDTVLSTVQWLADANCVTWGFRFPFDERTDSHLCEQLAAMSHVASAQLYLDQLRDLRTHRDRVEGTAGDPDGLRQALHELRRRYRAIALAPGTRTKRESADSRGILWLDTMVDWDVILGREALHSLAGPLGLLLDVARWITWRIACEVEALAAELIAENDGARLPFDILFDELRPELTAEHAPVVARVIHDLQAVVSGLVDLGDGSAPRRLTTVELAPTWRTTFAAPGPDWPAGATHSADVMLAASSADAANRGDYQWVLGELHVATNPLVYRLCVLNQRDFTPIEALADLTTGRGRYVPALPRHWARLTPRAHPVPGLDRPARHVYWTMWPDDILPDDLARLRGTDLVAEIRDGRPVVTGNGVDALLVEVVGEFLSTISANAFRLLAPAEHSPRVSIDRLVVCRERWRLPVADLMSHPTRRVDERLTAERLRSAGIPRFFFYRIPGEPKPLFCDLASEPLVKNLLRLLRAASDNPGTVVHMEEMLPGFDELWLAKSSGGPRTCEFRILAVDGTSAALASGLR